MNRFLLLLFLFYGLHTYSQIDPAKADSLARVIASRQKTTEAYQDSFIRAQDSIYHSGISRSQQGLEPATSVSEEINEEKRNKERQLYIRWGVTVLLLVLLVIGWRRFRKKTTRA